MNRSFFKIIGIILTAAAFSTTALAQEGSYSAQTKEMQDQQGQAGAAGADSDSGFIDEYNSKYSPSSKPTPMNNNMPSVSLLPQGQYSIYFVNSAAKPNEAVLHISSNESVSGCIKMSPIRVVSQEIGPTITYKISDPNIGVNRKTRYSQFECATETRFASADITLDRDYLIDHGIHKIGLQSAALITDYYKVDITDDHIALIAEKEPQAFRPFNGGKTIDPLAYAFTQTK